MTKSKVELDAERARLLESEMNSILEDFYEFADSIPSQITPEESLQIAQQNDPDDDLIDFYADTPQTRLISEWDEIERLIGSYVDEDDFEEDTPDETRSLINSILDEIPSPSQSSLKSNIGHLLADFDPNHVERFHAKCQSLVDAHGFAEFKKVFDDILMNRKIVKEAQHNRLLVNSIRSINQFITTKMADTFTNFVMSGVKLQAEGILSILRKPLDGFEGEAKEWAIKDTNEHAVQEIEKIKQDTSLGQEEIESKVASLNEKKEKRLEGIENGTVSVADYVEKLRLKAVGKQWDLQKEEVSATFIQPVEMYVINDLLMTDEHMELRDLLKLRTVKMERYIALAEKLIAEKQGSVAYAIYTALESRQISRLMATTESLSEQAQAQYERIKTLFSVGEGFKNYKEHAQKQGDIVLPSLVAKTMDSLKEVVLDVIKIDAKGNIATPSTWLQANSEQVERHELSKNADESLLAELESQKAVTEEDRIQLDTVSRQLEPRDTYIKPKSMHRYERIMAPDNLESLIRYHNSDMSGKLLRECRELVTLRGFKAFEADFDRILAVGDLDNRKALKLVSRFIMDTKFQTLSGLITTASKDYATNVLDILKKPDDFFGNRSEPAVAAYKKNWQDFDTAIEKLNNDSAQKIQQIQESSMSDQEKNEAVASEQSGLEAAIKARTEKTKEQIRRDMVTDSAKELIRTCQMVNNFVTQDITSCTSMDERTILFERYLLLTEKLIVSGDVDTAFHIFGALTRSSIDRLNVTKAGLSSHAKEWFAEMEKLYATGDYYSAIVAYSKERGIASPLNLNITDVQFAVDKNPIIIMENGQVKNPIVTIPAMTKVISNCTVAKDNFIEQRINPVLHREMITIQSRFDGKTDDDILYNASLKAEPRGTPVEEASGIVGKAKHIMRSGLYEPVQQEVRERKQSILDKIQVRIDQVKEHISSKKEQETEPSPLKVKMNTLVSALMSKTTEFLEKSREFLAQYKLLPHEKINLKNLSKEQLTDHMDQIMDDLNEYHQKHGGDLERSLAAIHRVTNTPNPEKNYRGVGQKRYYTADLILDMQELMKTGFTPETGTKFYNKWQNFIALNFMNNSSAINDLVGKEPTLIRMVREKVIPVLEELAHRNGLDFTYTRGRLNRYQLQSTDNNPQHAINATNTAKSRLQAEVHPSPKEDEERDTPHL